MFPATYGFLDDVVPLRKFRYVDRNGGLTVDRLLQDVSSHYIHDQNFLKISHSRVNDHLISSWVRIYIQALIILMNVIYTGRHKAKRRIGTAVITYN